MAAIPAAILALVAAAQIPLALTTPLTPWKGGGFGMFSSLDYGAFRGVRVFVEAPGRSEEILLPPSLQRLGEKVETYPSDRLVDRLARDVAAEEWAGGRPVTTVRVEVWRTEFAPQTLEARLRLVRDRAVRVAADGR
jgi:hypothetical protein